MTMLTHPGSEFTPASHRPGQRRAVNATTAAYFPALARFCVRALGPLLAGCAVAGIVVLKASIFLSRINY